MVRVRFAPSPTGYLHIGLARTALYNWLFSKKYNGRFILRIEDTDELRSTKESVLTILESLSWLGLEWAEGPLFCEEFETKQVGDYGPYFQMQRLNLYKKFAEELLQKNMAYYCYCSPEELEESRKRQISLKKPPKYEGKCRNLTPEERNKKEKEGRAPTIRFKMPKEGTTKFFDLIRDKIEFENKELEDFIIMKANGTPTYNFAVVIDDHLMEITHVIRGDDHISNTPKQIQLYNAFGWQMPKFAHLPMILGPDGTKLSKRHGATSVLEYRKMGYLPEALRNYLVLLGWSTEDSQQIFEKEEIVEKFSIERCSKSPAIFDPQKLLWMNSMYIKKMSVSEFAKRSLEFLDSQNYELSYIEKVLGLEKEKIKTLSDIPSLIDFFLKDDIVYETSAIDRIIKKGNPEKILEEIKTVFENESNFESNNLEKITREYANKNNLSTPMVFHPIRVAVSGRMEGPSLFDMLEVLGKERVIKRIELMIKKLNERKCK